MTFGNKLYNLRKNRGMSQEDLASELNTSRQAVSKWETDKGFPETDTLLMISNLFGVTIDSLLKDDGSAAEEGNGQGYYASRECVQGFLSFERRKVKLITAGISIILSGAIPTLLPDDFMLKTAFTILLAFIGVGCILLASFRENRYKAIREEPLIFDNTHLSELRNQYNQTKKKLVAFLIIGVGIILATGAFSELLLGSNVVTLLLVPVGAYFIVYSLWMMNVYSIITNNKAHIQGIADEKAASERFKARFNYWHVIAVITLILVALYFIYTLTGGDGWVSNLIDSIIR